MTRQHAWAHGGRLCSLLTLVLVLVALLATSGSLWGCADRQAEPQPDDGTQAATTETQGNTDADDADAGDAQDGSESGGTGTTATGIDTRDADFAVDPERTEWNFEPSQTKTVYLTFDDGPSYNTQEVLDILDRYGIKATFFVTNINPEYAHMIKECYERGHTIGLHTYSHDYEQVYASVDAYWEDLGQIGELVREQIGYVPCFIRFPGGSSNTISANYTPGIMTQLSQDVVDAGYQYFDWDASCGDGADHTADELVDATMADTSYGYQNIVFLAHDGAGKDTTVEALPRMIEYFQEEGYEFAPIDRDTCVPHHGIGN
ncbi:MAG: polysaccharide deacetylase family protein [Coriobacteriales bacterium]|nr:polysaccharide deacetylase family protein [Coriobacteriales bacterium]